MDFPPSLFHDLLAGSARAWGRFVRAAAPLIAWQVRRCFARYGTPLDPMDMEDVSQDAFIRLSRADFAVLRRFDPTRAKLSTYVGVIAHSACVDHLRKRRQANENIDDHAPYLVAQGSTDPSHEDAEAIKALVPATLLSPQQHVILAKLFEDDQDVEDVANDLGLAAQTVRSAKHKALTKIRRHFDQHPELRDTA